MARTVSKRTTKEGRESYLLTFVGREKGIMFESFKASFCAVLLMIIGILAAMITLFAATRFLWIGALFFLAGMVLLFLIRAAREDSYSLHQENIRLNKRLDELEKKRQETGL